jgi:K+-transporting ATPase ATPase C chain
MRDIWLGALRLSLVTLVLCGLAYPLALTALGQWLMPWQANGSLKTDGRGEIIGSQLIGQEWFGPEWFHGRPSATTTPDPQNPDQTVPAPYNAAGSGGSRSSRRGATGDPAELAAL